MHFVIVSYLLVTDLSVESELIRIGISENEQIAESLLKMGLLGGTLVLLALVKHMFGLVS